MSDKNSHTEDSQEKPRGLVLLNLPVDHAYTNRAVTSLSIGKLLTSNLHLLSQRNNTQLFTTLIAAFKALLYRYSAQKDICVGIIDHTQARNNHLVDIHALTSKISGNISFTDFLWQTNTTVLNTYKSQEIKLEQADDTKEIKFNHSSSCQFLFAFRNASQPIEIDFEPLIVAENCTYFSENDLFINLIESPSGIEGSLRYSNSLYTASTISRMVENFYVLLQSIVNYPDETIDRLTILSQNEKHELLTKFNITEAEYPKGKTVIDLFEEQVSKSPDSIAVIYGDKGITYNELNERSNQLGHYLISKGIKNENLVPICLERSTEMIIGILGILKAGGTYVPIDPEYPEDRIQYMLENAESTIVLCNTKSKLRFSFDNVFIIDIENDWSLINKQPSYNLQMAIKPDHLAYVIYTSGSTGRPKGAGVFHKSVVNLLQWYIKEFEINYQDSVLIISSFAFDLTQKNIFSPLLTGAKITLAVMQYYDSSLIADYIQENAVTFINCAPNAFYPVVEDNQSLRSIDSLRLVILGGEPIHLNRLKKWITDDKFQCEIVNSYGPTECTDIAAFYRIKCPTDFIEKIIPIGKPNDNVTLYILNNAQQLQPVNVAGELCIAGEGVGIGYLNDADLTAKKFINNPFSTKSSKLYKTGDLARWLPDGNIEYLGRIDDQVKIRGHRIELGEIESVLQLCTGVKQCAVIAKEDTTGSQSLIGYIVPKGAFDKTEIIKFLQSKLPDYMIPNLLIELEEIPLTGNGKVDRKSLPNPDASQTRTGLYVAPASKIELNIASAWKEILATSKVSIHDNFFESGGNSLLAVKITAALKNLYEYNLPVIKLYQYPTVTGIADYLEGKINSIKTPKKNTVSKNTSDVAVIGMAGRFPGADTIEDLWDLLKNGKETISFFSNEELDDTIPNSLKNDPDYIKARGVIKNAQNFDASFFGLNPKLAEVMDPQQRIFLEIAWEVMEKSGHLPEYYDGSIGVYAGCGNNTYYLNNVLKNKKTLEQVGEFRAMTVNEKDYISSRASYQLNLKGPAVGVYSACSTSLLAINQAVEGIRNGHCDIAIAGGSSITSPINSGHLYQEGSMMSSDGHCRSFDAEAKGTIFSDGAGVVLLKSLEAAKQDGDTIYAVIKGIGVNNDGSGKGSFTAPSAEGQAYAISKAIEDARIDPVTITYVEAHGTATPIGDPIEIEGLKMAFGDLAVNQFCAIGSIKSNMGHLTAAAGVAGFIKTTLALHYRQIPASLGYEKPNPNIDFANSPFYVNTHLAEWNCNGLRRAGISSFGIGGTNVHTILEEYVNEVTESSSCRPLQLITWSAKSEPSLDTYAKKLAEYTAQNTFLDLADVAYTLQTTRANFNCRRFIIANNHDELQHNLLRDKHSYEAANLTEMPGELVFMFPGQGSQYLNMGRELYETENTYRFAVNECAEILLPYLSLDIRQILFPENNDSGAEVLLKNTRYTQPAIFVTEYALAKLWMSWDIQPAILCGHSIGEFVAAHFAGIFTLEDALKLIAIRGHLVSELPCGQMLSVRISAKELSEIIPDSLSLAAINTHKLCVVAGENLEIEAFAKFLDNKEVPNSILATSHAFHSDMMTPIIEDFKEVVSEITLSQPKKPIVSTVTGTWLTDAQAMDADYWAQHLRLTVRFAEAVETILEYKNIVFLEAGPGNVTSILVKQQIGNRNAKIVTSLDKATVEQSEGRSILKALGQLWINGLKPDWKAFYNGQTRNKVTLPTYAFDRKLCWVEPVKESLENTPGIHHIQTQKPSEERPAKHIFMRNESLIKKIKEILEDTSGIETTNISPNMTFLEIGLDSLLLTQVALTFKKKFGLPFTFRQLSGELDTIELIAEYLDNNLPADNSHVQPASEPQTNFTGKIILNESPVILPSDSDSSLGLITQQLHILSKQVALLQSINQYMPATRDAQESVGLQDVKNKSTLSNTSDITPEEAIEIKKPFGATARIDKHIVELNDKQRDFLKQLTARYNRKTARSKMYSQQHRSYMADPRVVSGFKPLTKEIVYPIVINKSKGSRLWDLDGNEYIDALNGFGSNMFGYQPDFIKNALHDQVEKGYEVGPQHQLAGEVSKMICEFTGFDRAALCSTGSEAVLGTMRIARTVTGRSLIVAFSGSYHGIVDEVLVRGTKKLKSFPAASGIMPEAVQNMLILDYGTDESLQIIKERANELAAILVEPVQSRRPEFVPVDFLKQVREVTSLSGTALIFDEVITGFRMHPGGAQALFDIKADLASYGKVVGGGLPIGVIAGKKEFMDALDGGFWQYGDASFPEVGVTYFAGTFVRHPLALATAKASLQYMKDKGPNLQRSLNEKSEKVAAALNIEFEKRRLPFYVAQFGSLWKIKFNEDIPYSELLFTLMREKGIHVWDGFPCFMTEAHTNEEIDLIIKLFIESADEMISAGFFKTNNSDESAIKVPGAYNEFKSPPTIGAKLGRDKEGNPAWFISNPEKPGKYLQVELK